MNLANRLVRREIGVDRCSHDLLSARNSSRKGQDPHPVDYGGECDDLLKLWFVAHNGGAVRFRSAEIAEAYTTFIY